MSTPVRLGAFVLGPPLGEGGTASVFHARHEPSGAPAAVKVVRRAQGQVVRNDLRSEVRAVVALDHPHIVAVYDVGLVDEAAARGSRGALTAGTPWYAMELAEEGPLTRRLRTLDWPELAAVLRELLSALAHAHARGVLHLDVKPGNVLFGRRPGAKLSDFGMGLVGPADPDGDFVRGTPHFMAPEQVRGRWDELGPWTDLYALGCVAWRCVTGALPIPLAGEREVLEAQLHAGPGAYEPRMDAPSGVEAWIRQLLHKDPASRFRYAADAAAALDAACGVPRPAGPRLPVDWRVPDHLAAAEVVPTIGLGLGAIREPPMVGRVRERERLWRALRRVADGELRVVVLRGPFGVGKSRLARWLAVRAHELGAALVLAAERDVGGEGNGLLRALRDAFPCDPGSMDAEGELGGRLARLGMPAPTARIAAAWLARGPDAEPELAESWLDVAVDVLAAAASIRAPIVWLDAAHAGDASLTDAWAILTSGRAPASLWLWTADDEALLEHPEAEARLAPIEALPFAEVLRIGPLSTLARATLSRRILPLDPGVSAEVAERGGGSPRYHVDLVHAWARRGALEPGPVGFRLAEGRDDAVAPAIDAEWGAALDRAVGRAPPAIAAALEVAAVLGADVDTAEWQSACGELGLGDGEDLVAELVDLVDALIAHRLARWVDDPDRGWEQGRRWAFVQPAVRDTVLARAADAGRLPAIHLACARVIDPGDAPSDAERRAHHLVGADRHAEALPALLAALATSWVDDVGPATRRLHAVERAAERVLAAGDPRWAEIEDARVRLLLAQGRTDEAHAAALRQRAAAGDDAWRAFHAERNLATIALERADGPEALAHAEVAGHIADGIEEPSVLVASWVLASAALRAVGRFDAARDQIEWASLLVFDAHGPEAMDLWLEMALVAVVGERYQAARRALERLAVAAEATRSWGATATAALREGDAWLAVGEAEHAIRLYRTARRRFRALGHADEGLAQLGLAAGLVALGRDDEADAALERLRSTTLPDRHRLRLALVEVALRAARPADPGYASHWREARGLLDTHGALEPGVGWLLSLAVARTTRPERARDLAAERARVTPSAADRAEG